ncbi:MAG: AEC family transporter [Ruminococcaceae bacterium]|nr:AEC family transporter [Oscillospiraceae bacterium]
MNFISLLNTIATLFVLIVVGFIAGKLGVIDEVSSKKLSKLIINIGQPFLLVSSLIGMEYSADNLVLGGQTFILGFALHGVIAVLAYLLCFRFRDIEERKLSEFATLFGNVGFIGFPILESLFGARGLFMGAFIMIGFNILIWTWGIAILARKRTDIKLTIRKILLNYGTVPSAIGILIYISNINMPDFVYSSCSYLASLCTPISVLITGALLSRCTMRNIFLSPKIYYVSFTKLIFAPLSICILAKLCGLGHDWILFLTAVAAMPSASTISMLSDIYDIKPAYAAQTVGTSSLLSIATMPAILWIAERIAIL